MNRVYGRVVVKENNLGIPGLVVALFDIDIEGASFIDALAQFPPGQSRGGEGPESVSA